MTGKDAKIYFANLDFNEYQIKGFGGVRVYSNGSIYFTAFLLTDEGYFALPVSANLTIQSPQFNFTKEKQKFNEYLTEYGKVAHRFGITLTTAA